MTVTGYKLVAGSDPARVEARVNELITEGWQPFGPPFIRPEHVLEQYPANSGSKTVAHQFVQTMVYTPYEGPDGLAGE
jgi:hypothetical protein